MRLIRYAGQSLVMLMLLATSMGYAAEPVTGTAEANHIIHEELRNMLHGITQAINTKQYQDLKPYFDERLRVTTINQQVITTRTGIDAYFQEWFGSGGYLKTLHIELLPDALTQLYGPADNPSWGLVSGDGIENYQLTDGRYLPMKTRWTATVVKNDDGKWRILALHIGANFYDNPIFAAVQDSIKYYAAGGLLLGLLLGSAGAWWWLRRKRQPV